MKYQSDFVFQDLIAVLAGFVRRSRSVDAQRDQSRNERLAGLLPQSLCDWYVESETSAVALAQRLSVGVLAARDLKQEDVDGRLEGDDGQQSHEAQDAALGRSEISFDVADSIRYRQLGFVSRQLKQSHCVSYPDCLTC